MTQEELSLQEYRFSRVINTSGKQFSSNQQPSEVDLAACFYAFFQREHFLPPPEEPEPVKTPEEHRRQALDDSLLKLSSLETAGKEHIAEYLRHQYAVTFKQAPSRAVIPHCHRFFASSSKGQWERSRTSQKPISRHL